MIPLAALPALCFALAPTPDCRVTSVWVDTGGVLAARLGERDLHASLADSGRPTDFLSYSFRAGHLTDVPTSFAVRRGTFWSVSGATLGAGIETDRMSLQKRSSEDLCAGRRPQPVATSRLSEPRPDGKRVIYGGASVLWTDSPGSYEMQLPSFGFDKNARLHWIEVVPVEDHACIQFDLAGSAAAGFQLLATRFDATEPKGTPVIEKLGVFPSAFGGQFRPFIVGDVYYFLDQTGDLYCCEPDGKKGRKAMERIALPRPVRMVVTDARAKDKHFLFSFDAESDEVEYFPLARKPEPVRCTDDRIVAVKGASALEAGWAALHRLDRDGQVSKPSPEDKPPEKK